MKLQLSNFFILLAVILAFSVGARAQSADASSASGRPEQEDYSDGIKETLAKQRIKTEEKQFAELIDRTEQAAAISEELNKSFETTRKFTSEDAKKLDRLEKIVKKIRQELGSVKNGGDPEANDDDAPPEKPLSVKNALGNMREDTSNLLAEIKKAGRFSISVAAIESSNSLLRLVRFLRSNQN